MFKVIKFKVEPGKLTYPCNRIWFKSRDATLATGYNVSFVNATIEFKAIIKLRGISV